jgi:hypothetical protein
MVYLVTEWSEVMTSGAKVNALNNLDGLASQGVSYIDAFYHDLSNPLSVANYRTQDQCNATPADGGYFRGPLHPSGRNDGDSSGLNAKYVDGYSLADLLALAVPSGAIAAWAKSIASIPSTWLYMDGNNGTLDARGRLLVCSGNGYTPGQTGGTDSVTPGTVTFNPTTVALTTNQIPKHQHPYSDTDNQISGMVGSTSGFPLNGENSNQDSSKTTTGVNGYSNASPFPHGHDGSQFQFTGYLDQDNNAQTGALPIMPRSKAYAWIVRR